jgi:hypothetical protein
LEYTPSEREYGIYEGRKDVLCEQGIERRDRQRQIMLRSLEFILKSFKTLQNNLKNTPNLVCFHIYHSVWEK